MDEQTRDVILEFITRLLESADTVIEKIPVNEETKRIVTELIDLSKNSRYLHNDLFGQGGGKIIDIGDAASRIFGNGINWGKIALFLQFAACCCKAYTRRDIVMFVETIGQYFGKFHIQKWVENKGGWGAVLRANRTPIALGVLGVVGALAIGGIMYNRRRRN
ncbi:unnamed protein product [Calicophoron daubneyi]|uniref:Bcl-2 Bcl-2 homology region 1-3 domain-containing protein n=1 Tax=Calicophoron daubneyi TaxID=300641 RepID=A0AAV2T0L8_CALDB